MIPGRGVAAKVEGYHVLAGNRAMLNENNITFPQQMTTQAEEFINRGCTRSTYLWTAFSLVMLYCLIRYEVRVLVQ